MRIRLMRGLVCVSLALSMMVCGSGCGGNHQATPPPSGPTVTSLAIAAADVSVGQNQQLTAKATYSDGTQKAITPQSWSSSNTSVASVDTTGVATGVAHGQTTIIASYGDVTGSGTLNVHGGALTVTLIGAVTGVVNISGAGFNANISSSQTVQVPPDTFTVSGNAGSDSSNRYFPSTSSQSVAVADGGTASVTIDYSTIIPNTTKVLDSAGLASLVVVPDSRSITISSSSAVAGSLQPGDVLAIAPSTAAPSGLLLGIVSVTPGASTISATVQTVGLADAVEQGNVQYSGSITPNSLTPASRTLLQRPRRQDTGVCAGNSATIQLPYSLVLAQDSSGSVSLSGEADLCSSISVQIQIAEFALQSFNATEVAGLHTSIALSDTVQGSMSATQDLPAFQGNTITVLVGDVPIGLTPIITPFVGASANADATVSTGLTADSTLTLGITYANGAWSPVDTATSPVAVASTTSANANATVKGWAGLRLGVDVSQPYIPKTSATVSLSGDGYLQLTAGLHRNPCWTLDGGLEGSLGISAVFLGKKVPAYSSGTVSLYSGNVAQATGPCYTVKIYPATQNLDVGQSDQFSAQETDLLGNTVQASFNWASSDPTIATVDGAGNVKAVSPGTATITATDPKTTVAGTATVVVGSAAPSFFLVGNWAGTITYVAASGITTNYDVGVSLTQNTTTFDGTFTDLTEGDVPNTYTINGQINGSTITFSIAATSDSETEQANGSISSDGLQVSGNGVDGSNGSILWDGNLKITGSATLLPGSVDSSETATWTGNILTDGQHLTGGAQSTSGDNVTWNLTRQ